MNKSLFSVLIATASATAFAQHQQFNMQEATLGIKTNLAPQNLKQLNWIPGTNTYVYTVGTKEQEALLETTVPQMISDTLLRLSDINERLSFSKPLSVLPPIQWIKKNECYYSTGNEYYIGTLKNKRWEYSKWCTQPEKA
jgi:dipeptidyl-peptidase-4